jgi:large repetitive protein
MALDPSIIHVAFKTVFAREATPAELELYANAVSLNAIKAVLYATPEYAAQTLPIARLYTGLLGRDPDPEGLSFYINQIRDGKMTLETAAWGFLNSPEAASKFAYMQSGDQAFIEQLYWTCLHRAGEPAGIQFYLDQLAHGVTRAQIAVNFSLSPENVARVGNKEYGAFVFIVVQPVEDADTTPPAAPLNLDLSATDDTGSSTVDNITKNTSALSISGLAESGSTVRIYDTDGTTVLGTGVSSNGAFSIDISLSAGTHTITAKATDTSNNTSAASLGLSVTVDTTVPAAPSLAEQGSSDLGNSLMNAAEAVTTTFRVTLPVSGSLAVAGDKVELLLGGSSFGTPKTVTLSAGDITNGHVDFTVVAADLGADGAKSLSAALTDIAGNASASNATAFTLDATTPATPTLAEQGSSDLSNNLMNAAESVTTNFRVTLPVSGSLAVAGDKVDLLLGGAAFGTPKTATLTGTNISNGYVDFTVLAADLGSDGAKSLTAKITDAAGNVGNASNAVAFTLDATTPAAPALAEQGSTDLSDSLMNAPESVTTTFRVTLPVSGSLAVAGDKVDLLLGGSAFSTPKSVILTGTNISNGFVDFTVLAADLGADGAKSLTAKLTDVAGNVSSASNSLAFTLDAVAPAAPTLAEQGSSDLSDSLMNAAEATTTNFRVTLPVSGALAVAGDQVELLLGGAAFGTPKTATLTGTNISNGYVDFTVLAADLGSDGAKSLTAKIADSGGNVSNASNALAFTLDATTPAAPTLAEQGSTDLSDSQMNGAEATTTTFRATLPVSGSLAVAGDKVDLLLGGAAFGTPKSVTLSGTDISNGYVDFTVLAADLGSDGVKSLTAKITDAVGNVSNASNALAFTLDATPPAAPTLAEQGSTDLSDSQMNAAEATTTTFRVTLPVSGSLAVAGDKLDLLLGGVAFGTPKSVTLSGGDVSNGYVDFTVVAADLGSDGAKSLTAKITDVVGNVSNASNALAFTLDATPPAAPTIAEQGSSDLSDSLMNASEATTTTFRVTLPVSGSLAMAGDKVDLLLGGAAFGTPKSVTLTGTDISNGYVDFNVLIADLGSDGAKSLTAKITDAVGNVSLDSNAVAFTLDATTPAAPSLAEQGSSDLSDSLMNASEATTTTFRVTLPVSGSLALAGDKLDLLLGGAAFGTPKSVTLSGGDISNGYVDFTVLTADLGSEGAKSLTAILTDAAGNISTPSNAIAFTLDTTAPAAPTVAEQGTTDLGDSLMNAAEAVTTSFRVTLPVSGSLAVAGDRLDFLLDGVAFGSPKFAILSGTDISNGFVDFTVLLADLGVDGSKSLTAQLTDIAGNVGSGSGAVVFTLDTTAPAAPTLAEQGTTDLSDSLMNAAEAVTTTFRVTLPVSGSLAVAGDRLDLLLGGSAFGTPKFVTLSGTDISNGYVDFTVLAADLGSDGGKSLTAVITDVAGNAGTASGAVAFTLDSVAPAAPAVAEQGTTDLSDNLMNAAEAVTTTFRVTLPVSGSLAVAGDRLDLLLGGAAFGTPKFVTLSGTDISNGFVDFTVLTADLGSDGSKSLTAKLTDIAGNVGTASSAVAFTLDATPPIITAGPTAASATSLTLTSSEAGSAGLFNDVGSTLISGTSVVLVAATSKTITPLAAQGAVTTTSLSVSDVAGNTTTSPVKIILGTTGLDSIGSTANQDIMYGFAGIDTFATQAAGTAQGDVIADFLVGGAADIINVDAFTTTLVMVYEEMLNVNTNVGASNFFVINTSTDITTAATKIAGDAQVVATIGIIVLNDGTNTYVYGCSDLNGNGTETLLVTMVGVVGTGAVSAANFAT